MRDLKNDIEKYLRGELTPAEMNALERKALNDPFLADALEGAQLAGVENFQADMTSLQAALQNRVQPKSGKVVSLWAWPMRIAAGLLVLAVSTFIIISLLDRNQSSSEIAQVKENASPSFEEKSATVADSTVVNSAAVQADDDEDKDQELFKLKTPEEPKPSAVPPRVATQQNQRRETAVVEAETRASQNEQALADATQPEKNENKEAVSSSRGFVDMDKVATRSEPLAAEQTPTVVSKKARDVAAENDDAKYKAAAGAPAESRADVSPAKTIRGKVTSAEDGSGLPGVNVVIIGTNNGTVTDAEGNYHLTVETPNPELSFSFIGLESTEVEAGDNQEVDVAMNQDVSQLSEVVVVGYGIEGKAEEEIPTMEFAAPFGGRAAFKKYLEQNLRYPEQALENKIEGKVTVQFTVETTGKLTDFQVIKGLGYGCDEEVIRLIKKGPKWAATKRDDEPVKDKVKVRMRFRLPKK